MKVIGIVGHMGAGKTTIANELIRKNFVRQSLEFSSIIKQLSKIFFEAGYLRDVGSIRDAVLERFIKQKIGQKVREVCKEVFGHEDVFIDCLFSRIVGDVVISDIRMKREAERILSLDGKLYRSNNLVGYLIYLDAPEHIRRARIEKRQNGEIYTDNEWQKIHQHSTEMEIEEIVNLFGTNNRFLKIDATKNIDTIVMEIANFASLKQLSDEQRIKEYLINKYGLEPELSEAQKSWH